MDKRLGQNKYFAADGSIENNVPVIKKYPADIARGGNKEIRAYDPKQKVKRIGINSVTKILPEYKIHY
jgi:hypothetical protein